MKLKTMKLKIMKLKNIEYQLYRWSDRAKMKIRKLKDISADNILTLHGEQKGF